MMYLKVAIYAVHRDSPEDADAAWDDEGPELSGERGIELMHVGDLIPAKTGFGCTPEGYDPLWIEAINGVLANRETQIHINDLEPHQWEQYIGPLIDAIERGE